MALRIEAVDPCGADALMLLEQAAIEARALYPELFAPGAPMPTNPPPAAGTIYLVARDEGVPVGCAALRPLDGDTAEVRRMVVLKAWRRGGVARALLQRLEAEAAALGYAALKLETGHRQLPAMALYAACGYERIEAFGPHAGDPTSVCFGKRLAGR